MCNTEIIEAGDMNAAHSPLRQEAKHILIFLFILGAPLFLIKKTCVKIVDPKMLIMKERSSIRHALVSFSSEPLINTIITITEGW